MVEWFILFQIVHLFIMEQTVQNVNATETTLCHVTARMECAHANLVSGGRRATVKMEYTRVTVQHQSATRHLKDLLNACVDRDIQQLVKVGEFFSQS